MKISLEDRFWKYVDKSSDCWVWTAGLTGNGYGSFNMKSKTRRAHRVAYELEHGPIPELMYVCHTCDTRLCVRPSHLFLGTQKENREDASVKGKLVGRLVGTSMNKGKANGRAKLTEENVLAILKDTRTQIDIAKDYNVSKATIGMIKTGKRWKHVLKCREDHAAFSP